MSPCPPMDLRPCTHWYITHSKFSKLKYLSFRISDTYIIWISICTLYMYCHLSRWNCWRSNGTDRGIGFSWINGNGNWCLKSSNDRKWEWNHGNGREWYAESYSHTSITVILYIWSCSVFQFSHSRLLLYVMLVHDIDVSCCCIEFSHCAQDSC